MKHTSSIKKESETKVPDDLRKALSATPIAKTAWDDITPIARRDFITWIESAKQPETRVRRVAVTCDKLTSGKRRPCCYAVVPMGLYKALDKNAKAKAAWKDLTGMERRDFTDWIDETSDKEIVRLRIEKVCQALAYNKRHI